MTVAAVVVIATLGGAAIVWRRTVPAAAPKPIDPVSILVADFDNKTGDQVFDGALEQPLTIEMETAPFIQALPRDRRQAAGAGDQRGDAARRCDGAVRLRFARAPARAPPTCWRAASIPKERGYTLELRALDPSNGTVLKAVSADAKTKADVLSAVSTLAGRLRTALGDKTVNASKAKPNETFTAGSLEAFREYTTAQELQLGRHDAEAVPHYRRAIELDPKFGRSYSGLAISEQRLGHNEEADAAFKTALSLTDRMTDREKYRTFGSYYLGVTKNYEKAAEQFSALVAAYPADDAGFGNLGLTNFYLRDFTKAMDGAKHALAMNPKNILQRNNLALYAMYAGDFATASAEAKKVIADKGATESTYLPLVMEAVAKGDMAAAGAAYQEMATKTGALRRVTGQPRARRPGALQRTSRSGGQRIAIRPHRRYRGEEYGFRGAETGRARRGTGRSRPQAPGRGGGAAGAGPLAQSEHHRLGGAGADSFRENRRGAHAGL